MHERPLVPCPFVRHGRPCPNAAGVSGVCATHRRRINPAQLSTSRAHPRFASTAGALYALARDLERLRQPYDRWRDATLGYDDSVDPAHAMLERAHRQAVLESAREDEVERAHLAAAKLRMVAA